MSIYGKVSNYTGQAKEDEKLDLHLIAVDKDLQDLWRTTNGLPTITSATNYLPAGTITGDILYWDNTTVLWTILHPGIYGQVLMTQGDGLPPIWAWVFQQPGAQPSTDKWVDAYIHIKLETEKITMNRIFDQGINVNSENSNAPEESEPTPGEEVSGEVITMNKDVALTGSITSLYTTAVA